jgi:serine/threonine-protein kinase
VASTAGGAPFNCPACGESIKLPHSGPGPGSTVGGFRIERLIGIGGMGEVYLAKQLSMDRDVALKILPARFLAEQEVVERFLNEARLLARLEHPNIVTAHEAGQDSGVLFMAMAFVKGEPMDRKLDRDGPLPERIALALVRKVAAALAYAWNEHRMLHRDIKPANILLDVNGEPKLADLGLSRRAAFGSNDADEGTILGTPNYMSPEQVEGKRKPDFRSDMYSLGATLYHMLTGQLPFAAQDIQETLRKQVEESLPDPRAFRKDISPGCVELLTKVLAKDPDQRPESWESLMVSIDHLLGQRPPVRVRLSRKGGEAPGEIPDGHLARRTVAIAVGVLLLLSAVALYAVFKIPGRGTRPGPKASAPGTNVTDRNKPADPIVEETPVLPLVAPPSVSEEQKKRWEELARRFEEAVAMARANPAQSGEARRRMGALQVQAAGSPLEPVFLEKHAEWEKALAEEREREAQALRNRAREAASEPAILQTIEALQIYRGPFPDETVELRESLIGELKQRLETLRRENRERAARQHFDEACRQAAQRVLQSDLSGAAALLEGVGARPELGPALGSELQAIRTAIQTAEPWPTWIVESFRRDVGNAVVLSLASGEESWEIREVSGDRIQVRKLVGEGFLNRTLILNDLSLKELYRRVGTDPAPERELVRGLISLQAGRLPDALKSFEAFHPVLGPLLVEEAKLQVIRGQDNTAEKAFVELMRPYGIQAAGKSPMELAAAVRRRRFTEPEIASARQAVARYRNQYGTVGFAQTQESVLVELEAAATVAREVEPAEVETRLEALRRANPQAGEFRCRQDRSVRGLALFLDGNADLVSLQALEGLPLVHLDISRTRVRDLTPLKGMPLRELNLNETPVSDLEILASLPLERLHLNACPVSDLTPLAKLPLQELSIASTRIATLQPLRGKSLRRLVLRDTGVSTLRPLAGMPLEELNLQGCGKIESLEPLRGASLTRLVINGTQVRDLEPLTGMPLEVFEAAHTQVTRLQGLEKAPLNRVVLAHTPVSDLSPLAECPITTLILRFSKVTDLSVLKGGSVEELDLEGLPIRDLSPLLECSRLNTLVLPNRQAEWRPILAHPALRQIGFSQGELRPKREFWNPRGEPAEEAP